MGVERPEVAGGGEEIGGAVADGLADAFEVIEGIVELVAVAGLVGEAFLQAGFEFVAPTGELVLVFLQAGLRVRGRRSGGGGGTGGGGRFGHASGERGRVIGPPISRCKRGDGKYFFRWLAWAYGSVARGLQAAVWLTVLTVGGGRAYEGGGAG